MKNQDSILIFGSSGQIGKSLIRKFTKNNYRVTAVTRSIHQKGYQIVSFYMICIHQMCYDNLNDHVKCL